METEIKMLKIEIEMAMLTEMATQKDRNRYAACTYGYRGVQVATS